MHQVKSTGSGISLQITSEGSVVAPGRHHADAVVELNYSEKLTDISMA